MGLKFYMAYDNTLGSSEWASLVVAPNIKEAKVLAWRIHSCDLEEYIHLRVNWIKNLVNVRPLANQKRLRNNIPHTVLAPECCVACEHWGQGLDKDGMCAWCGEYPGRRLIDLLLKGVTEVSDE